MVESFDFNLSVFGQFSENVFKFVEPYEANREIQRLQITVLPLGVSSDPDSSPVHRGLSSERQVYAEKPYN